MSTSQLTSNILFPYQVGFIIYRRMVQQPPPPSNRYDNPIYRSTTIPEVKVPLQTQRANKEADGLEELKVPLSPKGFENV